tara:strand:+ start:130 stop:243 length:114 start_codon:yes stop_codon:yes gene_type:complete
MIDAKLDTKIKKLYFLTKSKSLGESFSHLGSFSSFSK